MKATYQPKIWLSAALAFCLAAPAAQAQKDTSASQSIDIEVEDTQIRISTEGAMEMDSAAMQDFIYRITELAQVLQQQAAEGQQELGKLRAEEELNQEDYERLARNLNESLRAGAQQLEELINTGNEEAWEEWSERYAEQMNDWLDNLEDNPSAPLPAMPPPPQVEPTEPADSAMARSGQGKTIIISSDGIEITPGNGDKPLVLRFKDIDPRKHDEDDDDDEWGWNSEGNQSRTTSLVGFHYGFNQLLANGDAFIQSGTDEQNFWRSNDVALDFLQKIRIGKVNSPLYLKTGIGVSWHDFVLQGNNRFDFDANGAAVFVADTVNSLDRSKIKTVYLNVPLIFQLDFTKDEYDVNEGFVLGLGAYGGIRAGGKRKLEYRNAAYREVEEISKGDLNINQFRYGLLAEAGWGNFRITGKYDLNSFFQDGEGADYQLFSVALGFTWQ